MTSGLPPELGERLRSVRSVGVITGAGVSAESGIQTYRGAGGLYDDPEEGDRTVEALTGSTLRSDPDLTWRTLGGVARQAHDAEPNPGHHALVEIENRVERFVLLTQNVDGLHQLAGSRNVIDIHGTIFSMVCMSCLERASLERAMLEQLDAAPRCPHCKRGVMRPDVVLFGELLSPDKVERIQSELNDDVPDLVILAGTSGLFPYIIEPMLVARGRGKLTVEVNPEETFLSGEVDFSLRGTAGTYLPLIAEAIGAAD